MRVAILNNRYERLIELNRQNGYVRNEKCEQYLRLLLDVKKRKTVIWAEKRKTNEKYSENLENAKNAVANYLTNQKYKN